jgi:hypothetical protein
MRGGGPGTRRLAGPEAAGRQGCGWPDRRSLPGPCAGAQHGGGTSSHHAPRPGHTGPARCHAAGKRRSKAVRDACTGRQPGAMGRREAVEGPLCAGLAGVPRRLSSRTGGAGRGARPPLRPPIRAVGLPGRGRRARLLRPAGPPAALDHAARAQRGLRLASPHPARAASGPSGDRRPRRASSNRRAPRGEHRTRPGQWGLARGPGCGVRPGSAGARSRRGTAVPLGG